jgi:hypothetical protein
MPQMIIANRLTDGLVVFLDPRENWNPAIGSGALIEGDADAERLLAVANRHVAECRVIDPQLIHPRGHPHIRAHGAYRSHRRVIAASR